MTGVTEKNRRYPPKMCCHSVICNIKNKHHKLVTCGVFILKLSQEGFRLLFLVCI